MGASRTWRRLSPFAIAIVTLALVVTLPTAGTGPGPSAHAEGEDLLLEPEETLMAVIEVADNATLSLLASAGVNLDHYAEPTPDGRVRSVAFVTPTELEELELMDLEVVALEDLPTPEEVAAEMFGSLDGVEVLEQARARQGQVRAPSSGGPATKEPPTDPDWPLRVLRADTFTNDFGDFLSLEVRAAEFSPSPFPNLLIVDEPSSAAGSYGVTGAAFGPSAPVSGFAGPIALADDGSANPTYACDPLIDFPPGAIALVDRGDCPFTQKVGHAQAAGAVAVVVANNVGSAPINLGGTDASITIPSGMISQADGVRLREGLPATGTFSGEPTVVATFEIDGQSHSLTLQPFIDEGQYIYHRTPRSTFVGGIPDEVTITYGEDTITVATEPWASYDEIGYPDGFQWGFITTGYPDAVDSTEKIEALAAEFPDLAEIIELPYQTHGYRRQAMRTMGNVTAPGGAATGVVVRSHAYGHEGGNDLTIEIVDPGAADSPLSVSVDGDHITVSQSTDAAGAVNGTAAQIVAALNAHPEASPLIHAHTYRGNAGSGVTPATARANLSDFLNAPEDKISRDPQTVKAIRIGKHRDGSKVGVWAYSQEHAREWVTPVVALEAAERLLRNYGTDPETTRYVDELDTFIIPTVNPDGTNYSLYDFAAQRRSMVNHCGDNLSDPAARNAWGVDLNRNFRVGTLWEGYSGASTSCTSDVYAGPSPLSEAETRNEVWLVDNHPNIRFSMNIHTHGGYFMWAPGAYRMPGRVPLERPSVGVEEYFFEASHTILGKIAEHRGTVVEPGRTGPIIDVLYSAAGNSADDVWYRSVERGSPIFAWNFEAGANRNTASGGWFSPGGFFPSFADEGFDQAMEFASGVYGLLEVAHEFATDDTPPVSTPNVTDGGWYSGPVDVEFELSEPATIYYTTDGSRPTFDSQVVERRDARDSAAPIRIDRTTTLRWFAVDAAGNIEGDYDPAGRGRDYRKVQIRIR
ncbi:M14 family metallopeptidase [Nitriliruptor alkaliphilus]|uniref:M14 family metallopeptidase n=1 Tax=Nitriliruptor alkaliphilus TaxID=427918 RepID=UPI0006979C5B|nr:M14 family zinc carboxypeptidase [Nitriliruptor alkaliphilus]